MRSWSRRRSLWLAGVVLVALGVAGWGLAGWPGLATKHAAAPAAKPPLAPVQRTPAGKVTIAGKVIDRATGKRVGRVTVVLLGAAGEATTTASPDGVFELVVPAGRYRAFVRPTTEPGGFTPTGGDDAVLTVGMQVRVRLDDMPQRELAGVADPGLMPVIDAVTDAPDIDLLVERAATLSGFVFDPDHHSVAGAVVRLREATTTLLPFPRPVLGTDIAQTDENGKFTLRVPAGTYELEATHEKLAGMASVLDTVTLEAGREDHITIDLKRGCIISGHVIRADGTPAADGALERDDADRLSGFGPVGRVEPDGSFRLAILDEGPVVLRAWPWKSPPAADKRFDCRDGKRHTGTVLKLGDSEPDLTGMVADAKGRPVPLAYVDIHPLDWTFGGQQERADAGGAWEVYELLSGRYRVTATAPGLGIADLTLTSPRTGVELQLSGTGRIAGTTTDLASGSFEVSFMQCGAGNDPIELAPEPRIVVVRGGRFTIDGAPACALTFTTRWRDRVSEQHVVVEPDRAAYLELAVGTPREKTVHGVVRDKDRKPVANARVTAVLGDKESATVRTDEDGRYSILTGAGAQLVGGNGRFSGHASVGRANVDSEEVDLVLEEIESSF